MSPPPPISITCACRIVVFCPHLFFLIFTDYSSDHQHTPSPSHTPSHMHRSYILTLVRIHTQLRHPKRRHHVCRECSPEENHQGTHIHIHTHTRRREARRGGNTSISRREEYMPTHRWHELQRLPMSAEEVCRRARERERALFLCVSARV